MIGFILDADYSILPFFLGMLSLGVILGYILGREAEIKRQREQKEQEKKDPWKGSPQP